MTNAVSQAEFARIMGWKARSHVTAMKNAGRLVLDENGKVLVEESKRRLEETADPNRDDVAQRHAEARGQGAADHDDKSSKSEDDYESEELREFQTARAKKEHYLAEQARIDYEQRIGKVVERADVEAAIADLVTAFRQSLENLPHRAAPELVAKDLDTIRAILKQEIHGALAELEREFSKRLEQIGEEE